MIQWRKEDKQRFLQCGRTGLPSWIASPGLRLRDSPAGAEELSSTKCKTPVGHGTSKQWQRLLLKDFEMWLYLELVASATSCHWHFWFLHQGQNHKVASKRRNLPERKTPKESHALIQVGGGTLGCVFWLKQISRFFFFFFLFSGACHFTSTPFFYFILFLLWFIKKIGVKNKNTRQESDTVQLQLQVQRKILTNWKYLQCRLWISLQNKDRLQGSSLQVL